MAYIPSISPIVNIQEEIYRFLKFDSVMIRDVEETLMLNHTPDFLEGKSVSDVCAFWMERLIVNKAAGSLNAKFYAYFHAALTRESVNLGGYQWYKKNDLWYLRSTDEPTLLAIEVSTGTEDAAKV
jgi:hypothetical protein